MRQAVPVEKRGPEILREAVQERGETKSPHPRRRRQGAPAMNPKGEVAMHINPYAHEETDAKVKRTFEGLKIDETWKNIFNAAADDAYRSLLEVIGAHLLNDLQDNFRRVARAIACEYLDDVMAGDADKAVELFGGKYGHDLREKLLQEFAGLLANLIDADLRKENTGLKDELSRMKAKLSFYGLQ